MLKGFVVFHYKNNFLAVTVLGNIFIQLSVTVVSRQVFAFDERFDTLFDDYWSRAEKTR